MRVLTLFSLLLLAVDLWFLWIGRFVLIRTYEFSRVGDLPAWTLFLFVRPWGARVLAPLLVAKEFSGWKVFNLLVNAAVLARILLAAFQPLIVVSM